ncbi:hypothetical protein DFP72DRAFT_1098697 [Ephemerocybe angulata]|uniref:Uncharacterized protein n=1 Tax=Ephemerocybe angulata TaxID=980116 RepID=A0A8H6I8B5_9AGAR|nr:hypothetical protein DFP72DRAFT_1098697 [Tulosesus angulatus]
MACSGQQTFTLHSAPLAEGPVSNRSTADLLYTDLAGVDLSEIDISTVDLHIKSNWWKDVRDLSGKKRAEKLGAVWQEMPRPSDFHIEATKLALEKAEKEIESLRRMQSSLPSWDIFSARNTNNELEKKIRRYKAYASEPAKKTAGRDAAFRNHHQSTSSWASTPPPSMSSVPNNLNPGLVLQGPQAPSSSAAPPMASTDSPSPFHPGSPTASGGFQERMTEANVEVKTISGSSPHRPVFGAEGGASTVIPHWQSASPPTPYADFQAEMATTSGEVFGKAWSARADLERPGAPKATSRHRSAVGGKAGAATEGFSNRVPNQRNDQLLVVNKKVAIGITKQITTLESSMSILAHLSRSKGARSPSEPPPRTRSSSHFHQRFLLKIQEPYFRQPPPRNQSLPSVLDVEPSTSLHDESTDDGKLSALDVEPNTSWEDEGTEDNEEKSFAKLREWVSRLGPPRAIYWMSKATDVQEAAMQRLVGEFHREHVPSCWLFVQRGCDSTAISRFINELADDMARCVPTFRTKSRHDSDAGWQAEARRLLIDPWSNVTESERKTPLLIVSNLHNCDENAADRVLDFLRLCLPQLPAYVLVLASVKRQKLFDLGDKLAKLAEDCRLELDDSAQPR